MFRGTDLTIGASTGAQYTGKVLDHSFVPSPIRIAVDPLNTTTGAVSATVTMYSNTYEVDAENFRFALVEEDVGTTPGPVYHTHVMRDLHSQAISLSGLGNSVTLNHTFTLDPSWDTTNLRVIAFVQLGDKEVIQAGSDDPQPTDKIRAMTTTDRLVFGPPHGTHTTGDITVMNIGSFDTYTVGVVVDTAPPGTVVSFTDGGGATHTTPQVFDLANEEQTVFRLNLSPGGPGQISAHLEITPDSSAPVVSVPVDYYTDDLEVMVIDDDGGETYEDYFTAALDTAGISYGIWDRGLNPLAPEIAVYYDTLIWNAGWTSTTFDEDDKVFVAAHLDAGNSLFVTGQDIGWEMNDPGASPSPADKVWYETYLKADYVRDNTGIKDLDGVPGDPLTDGLDLHIAGGDGANNQSYPDEIAPIDADATEILHYTGGYCGAIRSEDSLTGAKVVYLSFGFEAIDNAQDRHDMLIPAVQWLEGIIFTDGFESNDTSAWSTTAP